MLPDRDRLILKAVRDEGHSEGQVAQAAGVSQARVSQILRAAGR
jgi:DNA-directed RNA polymerase specialized sigma subunit